MSVDHHKKRLSSMKYPTLQNLAKQYGVKANQKNDKLVTALAIRFADNETTTDQQMRSPGEDETYVVRKPNTVHKIPLAQSTVNDESSGEEVSFRSPVHGELENTASPPKRRQNRRSSSRIAATSKQNAADESLGEGSWKVGAGAFEGVVRRSPRLALNKSGEQKEGGGAGSSSSGGEETEQLRNSIWMEVERRVQQNQNKQELEGENNGKIESPKQWFCEEYFGSKVSPSPRKTPGKRFEKAHEKEFAKMDSIDSHLEKKKLRHLQLTSSASDRIQRLATPVKKAAELAERQAAHKALAKKTPGIRMGAAKIARPVVIKPIEGAQFFKAKLPATGFKINSPARTPGTSNFRFGQNSPSTFGFGPKGSAWEKREGKSGERKRKSDQAKQPPTSSAKRRRQDASLNETFEYSPTKEDNIDLNTSFEEFRNKQPPKTKLVFQEKETPGTSGLRLSKAKSARKDQGSRQAKKLASGSSGIKTAIAAAKVDTLPAKGPVRVTRAAYRREIGQGDEAVIKADADRTEGKTPAVKKTRGGKPGSVGERRGRGYVPYKGPLKPFIDTRGMSAEKALAIKGASPRTMARIAPPRETARVARRLEIQQNRLEKKDALIMGKRNLLLKKK